MGDRHENNDSNPESDEPKVDICDNCEGVEEDNSFIDQVWKNYTDRPLLPLKPLQKARSCTNLVQTIKGFSLRKTSHSKRYSTPEFQENAFVDKRERCTSVGNISKDLKRNCSEIEEPKVRSLSDVVQPPQRKNFPWFHHVNGREASRRLLSMRQDGAFLIRPASNPTPEVSYTLCVVFCSRVYNFHVINLKSGYISLGHRKGMKAFASLLEMIKYHQDVPISVYLADSDSTANVLLRITPSKGE